MAAIGQKLGEVEAGNRFVFNKQKPGQYVVSPGIGSNRLNPNLVMPVSRLTLLAGYSYLAGMSSRSRNDCRVIESRASSFGQNQLCSTIAAA
jgi:hypothetical protein